MGINLNGLKSISGGFKLLELVSSFVSWLCFSLELAGPGGGDFPAGICWAPGRSSCPRLWAGPPLVRLRLSGGLADHPPLHSGGAAPGGRHCLENCQYSSLTSHHGWIFLHKLPYIFRNLIARKRSLNFFLRIIFPTPSPNQLRKNVMHP